MLESLCSGKLSSHNIVIEDESKAPGRLLALVMLHHMCQRYDQVLLLASERPPHFFINSLPASLRPKIQLPIVPKPKVVGERLAVGQLIAATQTAIQGSGVTVGVLIDSVTPIVFTYSYTAVPQLVGSLLEYGERGNKVGQVVSLIHRGVHEEWVRHLIRGQPDTWIQLRPSLASTHHQYSCLLHLRDSGKQPSIYEEEFNISSDVLHLQDVVSRPVEQTTEVEVVQPQADPTANLTFNLSLTPAEKAAKAQVVLPYTQISKESSESETGIIHYTPDEDDDFDEDDPDDDLDF